jgi:cytidyltransferase-like protein
MTGEPVGVIHGRFQPLHLGHLEYLLAGKERCDTLIVGITNPDPWQAGFEASDPARGGTKANPFTFYERYLMVEGAMDDAGVGRTEFRIVPFPHNHPERLWHYAPVDALYLLSIYDDWGETKLRRFRDLGLRTHVLWRRDRKVTDGSEVRARIAKGEPWERLVPESTRRVIRDLRLDVRIRLATGPSET